MKKIINGKMYNTETAQKICYYDNGLSYSDFQNYEERLYKTKAGQYFVAGNGGPMSHYAKSIGCNSWSGGEGLKLLTIDEAKEWLEHKGTVHEYAAEFGVVEG